MKRRRRLRSDYCVNLCCQSIRHRHSTVYGSLKAVGFDSGRLIERLNDKITILEKVKPIEVEALSGIVMEHDYQCR